MSVLETIIEGVQEDLALRKKGASLDDIQARLKRQNAPIDPLPDFRSSKISVIAEVKRASPSKGDLAHIADAAELAENYAAGGASAISVLTEERRFKGHLADLATVRQAVSVPILRKDFMVDEYQFYEARAYGADLVLLIVAALDDAQLRDFYQLTTELGMTALVETHNEAEIERAMRIEPQVVGVNNRNLKTLTVDTAQFGKLAPLLPPEVVKVAESGLFTSDDVAQMADHGADVVLIGEALVKADQPKQFLASLTKLDSKRISS